ncbi:hypothetical protein A1O7_08280 [Cladophialophora yegresii CBS 114405]|uniref:Xylanolytic transcriptional activator regulatory domain-containing protein n=1 Tax=Cladophialophora yegresii CBS 114405 TaxID=1182544 RepID=W9VIP7_9EURO|nr:uncharacterized protein A1O7_08280 [Cladophialophora yegresii CBS 114405]EXJ55353.1 hypothetical protein A1O7_08280 [Cladophialophora yegresii CBS 114405]
MSSKSYGLEAAPSAGETEVSSSVGSPGKQGELERVVGLGRGSGLSGFCGKMSEMSWVQRAFEYLLNGPADWRIPSYFTDEIDILAVNEDYVDPSHWPPLEAVEILTEAYFNASQAAFPFVIRERFLEQVLTFQTRGTSTWWSKRSWLALANVIWATSARWLQVAELAEVVDPNIHLLYYARARVLGLDHRVIIDHPTITQIQGLGVLSLYLLTNGSITRASNVLAQAIRHATALGLHLHVSDPDVSEADILERAWTWSSLYSLEVLVAEITGLPKSINLSERIFLGHYDTEVQSSDIQLDQSVENFILETRRTWLTYLSTGRVTSQDTLSGLASAETGYMPKHLPSFYFEQRLQLCLISDRIGRELYNDSPPSTWVEIQRRIAALEVELRSWAETFIHDDDPIDQAPSSIDVTLRLNLTMYYHSLQMILHRPCLCEIVIASESQESQEFNQNSARACNGGALSLLADLPDTGTGQEVCQHLPWWNLLHYLVQAAAVLLLELCLEGQHCEGQVEEISRSLRKAMAYIAHIATSGLSAYRVWRTFRHLLFGLSFKYSSIELQNIPTEIAQPFRWSEENESDLRSMLASTGRDLPNS